MKLNTGIYEISNVINGKRYIGSAIDLRIRKHTHFSELKYRRHYNGHLQNSYNKHGREAFQFKILLYCDHKLCLIYEQALLDLVKPEYNISPTATSQLGVKRSESTKAKLRVYSNRPEVKEKRRIAGLGNNYGLGNKSKTGKKVSKKTLELMSIANRGSNNPRAILDEQKVMLIRCLVARGVSKRELSRRLGVSYNTIHFAVTGYTWARVSYGLGV